MLRASAGHALNELGPARADADAALRLNRNDAQALLERGSIARDAGDALAARGDFESAVKLGGATADSARSPGGDGRGRQRSSLNRKK